MRIHPIFYISLLKPALKNAKQQSGIEILNEGEYIAEKIKGKKTENGKTTYLIKWENYLNEENI